MNESGKGAIRYTQFLNQTIKEIQILFGVELTDDEKMKLRLELNNAIGSVITDEVLFR